MAKLFGTDGVRGEAGVDLSPQLAFSMGQAAGHVLHHIQGGYSRTVLIGRDGRISGQMLEAGLVAGLTSVGVHVILLGVIPTPGVAWLVREYGAMAGIVISASHNPYWDNGIKFFDAKGEKLSDEIEEMIETLVFNPSDVELAQRDEIGQLTSDDDGINKYMAFLNEQAATDRFKYRVVVDCANGAASSVAETLFKDLGLRCHMIHHEPNGLNINQKCGSTDTNRLIQEVKEKKADVGLAFDGDADRFLAVDADGQVVDGDHLMAIYAADLKNRDALENNLLVVTVMSNLGLKVAMNRLNIDIHETNVGDRYVNEGMQKKGAVIGGEQSGHIIFRTHNTTGDGLLSAIMLLNVMYRQKKTLSELAKVMDTFPQTLINVRVRDKEAWMNNATIREAIGTVEAALGKEGRVLVRASGTEPLLRVMVEGPSEEVTQKHAQNIAAVVEAELGR